MKTKLVLSLALVFGGANAYALVYDLGRLLPWNDLDAQAAATDFAAGMIFGAKTPLDLAHRLQMFAGTAETVFAAMGIFATHLGSKPGTT